MIGRETDVVDDEMTWWSSLLTIVAPSSNWNGWCGLGNKNNAFPRVCCRCCLLLFVLVLAW